MIRTVIRWIAAQRGRYSLKVHFALTMLYTGSIVVVLGLFATTAVVPWNPI